jgi:hypothetical protein
MAVAPRRGGPTSTPLSPHIALRAALGLVSTGAVLLARWSEQRAFGLDGSV